MIHYTLRQEEQLWALALAVYVDGGGVDDAILDALE